MPDPAPDTRETPDRALIERCAQAVWREWTGRDWAHVDQVNRSLSMAVARAVLAEAGGARPPDPITAEDVREAWSRWEALPAAEVNRWARAGGWTAFVVEYLNRRTGQSAPP